jgi:hypothetical protein
MTAPTPAIWSFAANAALKRCSTSDLLFEYRDNPIDTR